jgi:glucokinase
MTEIKDTLVVGVDIGGTKVAAGLVDRNGEIKTQTRTPMMARGEASEGLAAVISAIDLLFDHDATARTLIRGIGICAPGPLDPMTGVVINPPNVPCWRNFPLAAEVEKVYGVPVKVENDANAAALAEAYWGAGRGYRHIFYAGIGTGIGTGIVCGGRIYNGRTGAAAEGGHMSIDYDGPLCGCGKPGCIEILAAGPAIARRARAKLASEKSSGSVILELAKGNIESVTSEMVGQAYAAGDQLAKQILQETVQLLSLWLSNIVDLLEPDVIIIGGGVAAMLNPLFGDIAEGLAKYCIISRCREIPLLKAHYGKDAGIAGGAALCSEYSI